MSSSYAFPTSWNVTQALLEETKLWGAWPNPNPVPQKRTMVFITESRGSHAWVSPGPVGSRLGALPRVSWEKLALSFFEIEFLFPPRNNPID